MSPVRKALIRYVFALAAGAFTEIGLSKREEGIFTCQLAGDTLGWLGLNIATTGLLKINPVVGVRHQPTERLVAQFLEIRFHPYAPPTISRPLGYLTPEKRYLTWYFAEGEGDFEQTVRDMAETIDRYGKPFMEEHRRLDALCHALDASDYAPLGQRAYSLPVVYGLLGKTEAGEQIIQNELKRLDGATYGYALEYRQYAEHCLKWLATQRSVN